MTESEMIEEMAKVLYESEYGEDYPWTSSTQGEKSHYLRMAEAAVTRCNLFRKPN